MSIKAKKMVTGKKMLVPAYLIAGLFVVLIFLQWIFSYKAVVAAREEFRKNNRQHSTGVWNNTEVRRDKKDIQWYEQLLLLSKSDSNYLAIDLHDSIVQLGLKGINLAEAEIIHHYPSDFLATINEEVYTSVATASPILIESANFFKKPVRKILAYSNADNRDEEIQGNKARHPLHWTFTTGNNLRIVISGAQTAADSSFKLHPKRDIMLHRAKEFIRYPVPEKYSPTLYLWLSDKDALAIYRALPSGGMVLFRN